MDLRERIKAAVADLDLRARPWVAKGPWHRRVYELLLFGLKEAWAVAAVKLGLAEGATVEAALVAGAQAHRLAGAAVADELAGLGRAGMGRPVLLQCRVGFPAAAEEPLVEQRDGPDGVETEDVAGELQGLPRLKVRA